MSNVMETVLPLERLGRCALLAWEHAVAARNEAPDDRKRPAIMTGHILLGVLQEPKCAGGLILRKMGLDLELATDTTRFTLFYGRHPDGILGEIMDWQGEPHTPAGLISIEYALEEANLFHPSYPIGTEHLLLGLLRANQSMASSLLEYFGVTHQAARAARDMLWERLKVAES